MRFPILLAAASLGLALGPTVFDRAMAQEGQSTPPGYGVQPYTPPGFHLPEGAGCSGAISRWQAIQANDYASGNINLRVYNEIQNEIVHAAEVCAAGNDAAARKLVAISKAHHGYPP